MATRVRTYAQVLSEAPLAWARALELLAELCLAVDDARCDGNGAAIIPEVVFVEEPAGGPPLVRVRDTGQPQVPRVGRHGDGDGADQLWRNLAAREAGEARWQPYGAPEGSVDDRSDVYTLGVFGYELVTARHPFAGITNAVDLRRAQLEGAPPAPSVVAPDRELPLELDEILGRCLAPEPRERYASLRALARALVHVPTRRLVREGRTVRALAAGDLPARLRLFERLCRAVARGNLVDFVAGVVTPDNLVFVGDAVRVSRPARLRVPEVGEEHAWHGGEDTAFRYSSPEVLMGRPCDERSVVYTLGVIGYELIARHHPFERSTSPAGLITAILKAPVPPPSSFAEVSAEVDRVLLACLERDPTRRPADVASLAALVGSLAGS